MRKIFLSILAAICLIACNTNQSSTKNAVYYDEFYAVLDNLVRYNLVNVSLIKSNTRQVYKTMWGTVTNPKDTINPPPPPPPGIISFDLSSAKSLISNNIIDSVDAMFMYHSIDSTKTFEIDSNRIFLPVISSARFNRVFSNLDNEEIYQRIKKIYGTSCFISVSTPIFNSNFTKVILFIDYSCGPLMGQGYEYILEKKDGIWRLIDKRETWVS